MLSIYSIPSIYCCSLLEYKHPHPVISYKIVQCAGTFTRKKGSPQTMFCKITEWVYESKRRSLANGTREVSWRTEYTTFYRILRVEMYEITTIMRYGVTTIYQMLLLNLRQWRYV